LGQGEPGARCCVSSNQETRQALERLYAILDRVNENDRAAFVLRFIEGLELSDVAAALGISAPTARRRFTRAYERVALLASREPALAEYVAIDREAGDAWRRRVEARHRNTSRVA
jgi:DNA-directed RNA polymerase specialized sigma24 family protein